METDRLKLRTVVRGPMLTEPLRLTQKLIEADEVRLIGVGVESGKVQEYVLTPVQLAQVEPVPEPTIASAAAPAQAGTPAGFTYYYLSRLLGRRIRYDGETAPFGRFRDLGIQKLAPYPLAAAIQVQVDHRRIEVLPWSAVVGLSEKEIVVRRGNGAPQAAPPPVDFWLRRDVLDDQVVDVAGAKVLRVNDVHMLYADGRLIIAHVEVGFLGVLRRLGFDRPINRLLRWLLDYEMSDQFVSWRHVEVISPGDLPGGVRVSAIPSRFAEIHPAELADIMEELGAKERQTIFKALDVETAAETLEKISPDVQRSLIAQTEPGKAADILGEMQPSEAADVLRDLHHADAAPIIQKMERDAAEEVQTILRHEEETAGGVMTTSCVEGRPDDPAGAVLETIRAVAEHTEVYTVVYVLDDARHLIGIASLRDLLRVTADTPLETIMATHLVSVGPDVSVGEVAKLFLKYGFRTIPVVDEQNVFLGTVRLRRALSDTAEMASA